MYTGGRDPSPRRRHATAVRRQRLRAKLAGGDKDRETSPTVALTQAPASRQGIALGEMSITDSDAFIIEHVTRDTHPFGDLAGIVDIASGAAGARDASPRHDPRAAA